MKNDLQMRDFGAGCMMPFGNAFAQALDGAQASSGGPVTFQTVVVYGKRASPANTCFDSAARHDAPGTDLALPDFSRNSDNIVGMHEPNRLSVRFAAGLMFNL